MYIKEIKDMINLMNENGLSELEVEKDGVRIKLKKGSSGTYDKVVEYVPPSHQNAQTHPSHKAEAPIAVPEKKAGSEIKSPMVGTFYRAPNPEAPAYVEVGQTIQHGQVICIIEAMKLMNEIKSEIKGKILEILVDNAEPVEFGQSLFLIDPL